MAKKNEAKDRDAKEKRDGHKDGLKPPDGPPARTPWLDDETEAPLVHEQARRLGTFLEAVADGKIDKEELREQELRVVALMKKIEPELGATVHEDVTALLLEMTAYNVMHTIHELVTAQVKAKFRG